MNIIASRKSLEFTTHDLLTDFPPFPVWREGLFALCGPGKISGLPQRMCVDGVPIGWYVPYMYGHNVRVALRITNVFQTVYFCIKLWQLIDNELDIDHKLSWFCVTDYISEILWLFVSSFIPGGTESNIQIETDVLTCAKT